LSYASNALKVVRVNAGATGFELATISGGGLSDGDYGDITVSGSGTVLTIDAATVTVAKISATGTPSSSTYLRGDGTWTSPAGSGDVVGPASATDNAIVRYDSTTGKLVQDSEATVSDDGIIRSATNSGANTVSVPLCNWCMLTADYALTNSVAEQKLFNTTTNGTLTLPTGVYEFEAFIYLTGMSATSGNFAFDPVGAGTAVTDRWGYQAFGVDNTSPLNVAARGGSASVTQQSVASIVTAATGTGAVATVLGMFRVSTGGTIIPSITLVTASAATAKAGTHFKIKKVGESSETSVGAWT
jgi:hypothetical protein